MTAESSSHQSDTTPDVVNFFEQWSRAIVSNNVHEMRDFTTEHWVLIDGPGIITRERFHAVVSAGELQHSHMHHDIVATRRYGPVALVLTRGQNRASFQGTTHNAVEWSSNLLVQDAGQWRCAFTQLTPVVE